MVPIHHSPDQRIVGASAVSLSMDVSHSRVKKMRENIAKHVLALRGVFDPLSEPLSVASLKGMEGTSSSTHDATTTLFTTFVSASTIPPISTDDYEVAHADGQGVPMLQMFHVRGRVCPLRSLSLYAPLPNASVTSYGPSHLDSSHHSGANIAEAEVDCIVRSSAPAIATVTTMTVEIDADATAARAPIAPCLFGVGSSSTGRTHSVPFGFSDVFGSDSLIGGIRTVVDPESDLQKVYLFTEFNVGAARQISLNDEAELLKVKDREIESLKAQLLLKEAEAAEAIRLRTESTALERQKNELSVKVTDLSASVKVREQEVANLDAQVIAVKLQNDNLVDQVHEQEISYVGLKEKVAVYEGFIGQLEKFQDKKLEEVNKKFDKLCAAFFIWPLILKKNSIRTS
uniref:Uncharacterized protein n=1 Tax=Tanacetum cinerariifolium TaxID=118510 RepID=A0A699IS69_TANCI|nr:hypothetical protein [Tanacetum cinerariifolium]